jgi:hypothetical protein
MTIALLCFYMGAALLVERSGRRAYSPAWVNVPFSLLWPVSLPLSVALGLLGVWDEDLDPTE